MSLPDVSVRTANLTDQPALEAFWSALMAEQSRLDHRFVLAADAPRRWRATLGDFLRGEGGVLFVAEQEGEPVGFLSAEAYLEAPVLKTVPEIQLAELYVIPEARRHGVALALLNAAEDWARTTGAERLRMSLLWRNEASRRLVERWGAFPHSVTLTRDV